MHACFVYQMCVCVRACVFWPAAVAVLWCGWLHLLKCLWVGDYCITCLLFLQSLHCKPGSCLFQPAMLSPADRCRAVQHENTLVQRPFKTCWPKGADQFIWGIAACSFGGKLFQAKLHLTLCFTTMTYLSCGWRFICDFSEEKSSLGPWLVRMFSTVTSSKMRGS